MKVIIPVAGFGTRLRPHTLTKPKVLLNVAGKPMIHFIVEQLLREKIGDELVFITGFLGDQVREYLDSTFSKHKKKFRYIVQDIPKGLGHAIYCAEPAFEKDEEALIILGDTLFDVDLKHLVNKKYSVIGTKKVDDPRRFGVVEKNKAGFITRMVEKPSSKEVSPSNDAIVGIYLLKSSNELFSCLDEMIESDLKTKGEYQLTDALAMMLERGTKMTTYNVHGWLDCGKPETLLETNSYILKHLIKQKKNNLPSSLVIPPAFIDEGCLVTNSVIGPNVTINKNCVIENCVIKDSVVGESSHLKNAVLTHSVIGEHTQVILKELNLNLGQNSEIKS